MGGGAGGGTPRSQVLMRRLTFSWRWSSFSRKRWRAAAVLVESRCRSYCVCIVGSGAKFTSSRALGPLLEPAIRAEAVVNGMRDTTIERRGSRNRCSCSSELLMAPRKVVTGAGRWPSSILLSLWVGEVGEPGSSLSEGPWRSMYLM